MRETAKAGKGWGLCRETFKEGQPPPLPPPLPPPSLARVSPRRPPLKALGELRLCSRPRRLSSGPRRPGCSEQSAAAAESARVLQAPQCERGARWLVTVRTWPSLSSSALCLQPKKPERGELLCPPLPRRLSGKSPSKDGQHFLPQAIKTAMKGKINYPRSLLQPISHQWAILASD